MYTSKHVWLLSFTTLFKFVGYNPGVPQSAQTDAAAFTARFGSIITDNNINDINDFIVKSDSGCQVFY